MAMSAKVRYLASDILDAPDDGRRYEVIDGELYVSKSPEWLHQRGLFRLGFQLAQHVFDRDLGEITQAPTGVFLDEANGVQPDLIFVARERLHLISRRGVEGAPDLIVEVLSEGTRNLDRGLKQRRYARAGVPHYWLLDPDTRTLEALRLVDGDYTLVGQFGPGDVFEPQLFPGLAIKIDSLWP